ncbi:MAG: hypothetical protein KDD55_03550 [Bdellovibrionales bacterium]|nr:hypothetical protein [Bdellovibrionales bacterium]
MSHYYNEVVYWLQQYGNTGAPDKQAVETFVEVETDEKVRALRGQLYAISQGKLNEPQMDKVIGKARKLRHGSYEDWAKVMLLWMSGLRG